ncbi:MAG: 23S rRNA (adenine(2503)-C(2))-methyltransferase RlmN, partial [Evtepia sp.]
MHLKSMTPEELGEFCKEFGQPTFRGQQIFQWLHRGVTSIDEMSNLPKALREILKEKAELTVPTIERKQVSKLDGTMKYLWKLADGNCIETVFMRYRHGN